MCRTICVIHPGAIGDTLLAVEAICALRSRFPRHRFMLCGRPDVGELLRECEVIHEWISIEDSACLGLFGGSIPAPTRLAAWLKYCDLAVGWMKDDEGVVTAALRRAGVRETRVQSPFSSDLNARHQADRYLETVQGVSHPSPSGVRIQIPRHLKVQGQKWLTLLGLDVEQRIALVHPGSGSRHKCIDAQVLAKLVERLKSQGFVLLILEGPADGEQVENVLQRMPVPPSVVRGADFLTVAGMLTYANVFIGHDSGVSHLSALMHVPTVVLFGPTDPSRWAPRGSHVSIVTGGAACRCTSSNFTVPCAGKECFPGSHEQLSEVCLALCRDGINPRNSMPAALSLHNPCVRVAS